MDSAKKGFIVTPELREKIRNYINHLIVEDYHETLYTDKNNLNIVALVGKKSERNEDSYNVLANNGIMGVAWEIGGATGGNCWGDEAQPYRVSEPDVKELYLLDCMFEQLLPDIKHSDYKEVMKKTGIHQATKGNYEYYGNCTEYLVRYVLADELIDALASQELKFDENHIDNMLEGFKKKTKPKYR